MSVHSSPVGPGNLCPPASLLLQELCGPGLITDMLLPHSPEGKRSGGAVVVTPRDALGLPGLRLVALCRALGNLQKMLMGRTGAVGSSGLVAASSLA